MSERTHLHCRCGAVEMVAISPAIMSTECHCTSCRSAAEVFEALAGAPVLRAPTGGTRTEMYRKDRVFCLSGAAQLREYRLNSKTRTRRVVAVCCNTPIFLDFTSGHWVDLFSVLWPEGRLPPLQMRTMTMDRVDAAALPDDVPNHQAHSGGFFLRLIWAWAAMGFRTPKLDYVPASLDVAASDQAT